MQQATIMVIMKPKEMLGGSTNNMKLKKNTSNEQKWHYGSFKLVFLILYLASLCSMSSGAYPTKPRFVIENSCGKYIHPRSGSSSTPQDDPLHLWSGVYSWIHYDFELVDGKWGYIRHIKSNKVWHPYHGSAHTREKGTRIVLHSDRRRWAQFSIDQVTGNIQHRDGYYVHVKEVKCDNGSPIHLWDGLFGYGRWKFVNPYKTSEEVLPYGSFKVFGDWQLVFAVNNPLASQRYEYTHKQGRSQSRSSSTETKFEWQVSASASFWFATVSTSASLTTSIQQVSSSTWYSEITVTHTINVVRGQPVAVWQWVLVGEQLGNKEVFQSNIFAHTTSRNVKPPNDNSQSNAILKLLFFIDDESIPMTNATEDIDYDVDGVFALYNYSIVDNVDAEHMDRLFMPEENELSDSVDSKSDEQQEFDYTIDDGSIPMTHATEDIDYDELEMNKVNQNKLEDDIVIVDIVVRHKYMGIKHDEDQAMPPIQDYQQEEEEAVTPGKETNDAKH